MFSKEAFQTWAKSEVVLFASVATKLTDRKDDALLRVYDFTGFPSLAYLDGEGEVITKKVGRDLGSMQTIAAAAPIYQKLKPKADAGETVDKNQWFLARLGMGKLKLEEAKKELAGLQLGADSKRADKLIFDLEMDSLMGQLRSRSIEVDAAGDAIYKFYKQGKMLDEAAPMAGFYDQMLVKGAGKAKDAKAFFFAYPRVKAGMVKQLETLEKRKLRFKDNKRAQDYFSKAIPDTKKQLDALESDAAKLKGKADKD